MEKSIHLLELLEQLKRVVALHTQSSYWVEAEIHEMSYRSNGHCYMELIEKGEQGLVVAKVRAVIWAHVFRLLRPYFETSAGISLQAGIQVLLKVQVSYHPLYGLSLYVTDINPEYSIGHLELERRRTIEKLKAAGVWEMNAALPFPTLPRRLAIISSVQAAGYGDFKKQLEQSGFAFSCTLFEAVMQGEQAPPSIIAALEAIDPRRFDVVLLLRGGGAAADLQCFDNYDLANNLARFPLPVITGIGHDRDEHIADKVAHTCVKTPTAAAVYLISCFENQEALLLQTAYRLQSQVKDRLYRDSNRLDRMTEQIRTSVGNRFDRIFHTLDLYEQRLAENNPLNILAKGYSITVYKNRILTDADVLPAGETVEVRLHKGGFAAKRMK